MCKFWVNIDSVRKANCLAKMRWPFTLQAVGSVHLKTRSERGLWLMVSRPVSPSCLVQLRPVSPSDPAADPACRELPVGPQLGCLKTNTAFFLNWSIVSLHCCVNFYCTANWISHTCAYIYPLFYGFPSCIGHHGAPSRIPYAIQ